MNLNVNSLMQTLRPLAALSAAIILGVMCAKAFGVRVDLVSMPVADAAALSAALIFFAGSK